MPERRSDQGIPTVSADMMARPRADEIPTVNAAMLAREVKGDGRSNFERGMRLAPPMTLGLIVVCTAAFAWEIGVGALSDTQAIIAAGALARAQVLAGEVWRLGSAMFLHGGFDHLFGNATALYILGMACEHGFGTPRTAVLYLLSGLGGGVASLLMGPGPSVGASGAIFGLMGAMIVFFRLHGRRFTLRDNRVGAVLLVWAVFSVVIAWFTPFIDNAAHVGGFVTGALTAMLLRPRTFLKRLPSQG